MRVAWNQSLESQIAIYKRNLKSKLQITDRNLGANRPSIDFERSPEIRAAVKASAEGQH